jgi:hypothetical protein
MRTIKYEAQETLPWAVCDTGEVVARFRDHDRAVEFVAKKPSWIPRMSDVSTELSVTDACLSGLVPQVKQFRGRDAVESFRERLNAVVLDLRACRTNIDDIVRTGGKS